MRKVPEVTKPIWTRCGASQKRNAFPQTPNFLPFSQFFRFFGKLTGMSISNAASGAFLLSEELTASKGKIWLKTI